MVVVPEFLIKRLYKKGSLKQLENGITFDLKNVLGPGFISGFNYIKINDQTFEGASVKFTTQGKEFSATDVSESNQISFRLAQEGSFIISTDYKLLEGKNIITIEAMNPEAGIVKFSVEESI